MRKLLILWMVLLAGAAYAADIFLYVDAKTNNLAKQARLAWAYPNAQPDTTGMTWNQSLSADHPDSFDTNIPAATAATDSGGIVLTWNKADPDSIDGYILEFDQGSSAWMEVTVIESADANDTTYTHAASDTPAPRRGDINYRVRAYSYDAPDTTKYAVSILVSKFMNQAVRVYTRFYADDGVNAVVASDVENEILISQPD